MDTVEQDNRRNAQNKQPVDDDEWVRRLRHVASQPENLDVTPRGADAVVVRTASSADVATTLRALADRLAAVEADLAALRRHHETLVDDIAAAVVLRLDARWAGVATDEV